MENYVDYYSREKNLTNLKVHLRSSHKTANLAYFDEVRRAPSFHPPTQKNTRTHSLMQSLLQCFHQRPESYWLVNSPEHHKWEEALVNIFYKKLVCLHDFVSQVSSRNLLIYSNQNSSQVKDTGPLNTFLKVFPSKIHTTFFKIDTSCMSS